MATAGRKWVDTTKLIEGRAQRQVTFSKRRRGLFAAASYLSACNGVDTAAVVFSEAGNAFAFGRPSVDAVPRRLVYGEGPLPGDEAVDLAVLAAKRQEVRDAEALVAPEKERMEAIAAKVKAVSEAGNARWWEADAGSLGEEELPEFERALRKLQDTVRRRVNKKAAPPAAVRRLINRKAAPPATVGPA